MLIPINTNQALVAQPLINLQPVNQTIRVLPLPEDPEGKRTGALRIHSDSFSPEINPGDLVLYIKTGIARPGQSIVVETPEGVSVKLYRPLPGGGVRLDIPSPVRIPNGKVWKESEIVILGIVRRVERNYHP